MSPFFDFKCEACEKVSESLESYSTLRITCPECGKENSAVKQPCASSAYIIKGDNSGSTKRKFHKG